VEYQASLAARENGARNLIPHQVLQNDFLLSAIDFSSSGKEAAIPEFDDRDRAA